MYWCFDSNTSVLVFCQQHQCYSVHWCFTSKTSVFIQCTNILPAAPAIPHSFPLILNHSPSLLSLSLSPLLGSFLLFIVFHAHMHLASSTSIFFCITQLDSHSTALHNFMQQSSASTKLMAWGAVWYCRELQIIAVCCKMLQKI